MKIPSRNRIASAFFFTLFCLLAKSRAELLPNVFPTLCKGQSVNGAQVILPFGVAIGNGSHVLGNDQLSAGGRIISLTTISGSRQEIIRTGQAASGSDGGTFTDANGNAMVTADGGKIALQASLSGIPGRTVSNAVMAGGPGSMSVLSYEGADVGPARPGSIVTQIGTVLMNASGQVAWRAASGSVNFLFVDGQATLTTGVEYPGLPGVGKLISIQTGFRFNGAGKALFQGTLQSGGEVNGSNATAIFMSGSTDQVSIIARAGDPAPGVGGAVHASPLNISSFADGEHMAVIGNVSGDGIDFTNRTCAWVGTDGNLSLIARSGDPAPVRGGTAPFSLSSNGYTTVGVAANGSAVLAADLNTNDPGVDFETSRGIWYWDGGGLSLLMRQGDLTAENNPAITISSIGSVAISPSGVVVIEASISDDSAGNGFPFIRSGIWATDASGGNLRRVAYENDQVDLGADGVQTIDSLELIAPFSAYIVPNGTDGSNSTINAANEVGLRVGFRYPGPADCTAVLQLGGGVALPGSIAGQVRIDEDGDGNLGDSDGPLEGVTVELVLNGTGVIDTEVTDGFGNYLFTDVPAGNYEIVSTNLPGYISTGDKVPPNDDRIPVMLAAGEDSTGNDFLDQPSAAPELVLSAMHRLTTSAIVNVNAGLTDVDSGLIPTGNPVTLENQPVVAKGMVADGVTPLIFRFQFDPLTVPVDREILVEIGNISGGNTLLGLADNLSVLEGGIWRTSTGVVTIKPSDPVLFAMMMPLDSDELSLGFGGEISAIMTVKDVATGANLGGQAFKVRKPPVTLIHGYNTPGNWGDGMLEELGTTRPRSTEPEDDFVIVVKYGQDVIPSKNVPKWAQSDANLANTVLPLYILADRLEADIASAIYPLRSNWALTRHDVVAHSQGGLLSRMLCSEDPWGTNVDPFQSAANHFRGRFHRIVTIGSPHNGSTLVRYIMASDKQLGVATVFRELTYPNVPRLLNGALAFYDSFALVSKVSISKGGVGLGIVQDKFDPVGWQIRDLNNPTPNATWKPDPDAKFHLVRTVVDDGNAPSRTSYVYGHWALGLARPGGEIVLPRGSDGVVDWDSMGSHGPGQTVPANVFSLQFNIAVSHSGPVEVFSMDPRSPDAVGQTNSLSVARHVQRALDQSVSIPESERVFSSFHLPPIMDAQTIERINAFAGEREILSGSGISKNMAAAAAKFETKGAPLVFDLTASPLAGTTIDGDILWFVEHLTDRENALGAVTWTTSGANSTSVAVTVPDTVIGDVVAYASYYTPDGTQVFLAPHLVVSTDPPGETLVSIQVFPDGGEVGKGSKFSPVVTATYSNGTTLHRHLDGNFTVVSGNPSVIGVSDPLSWDAASPGTATITVTYSGISDETTLTVVDLFPKLTYEQWKAQFFNAEELLDTALTGDAVDLDGDGMGTLYEYIFAGDPHFADPEQMPEMSISDVTGLPVIRTRVSTQITGKSVILQNSGSLNGWGTTYDFAVDPDESHPSIRSALNADSFHQVEFDEGGTVRDKLFYRFKVE